MKILISNDDGIYSEGIYHLAKKLSQIAKVYVVAPEKEQSAVGHGITMHYPLRCKKIKFFDTDIDAWWVNGTPADCIKLGIESIIKERPDWIVSGINKGENLGTDVLYSGTVSAAIEGAIFGVPSIALSYVTREDADYDIPGELALRVFKKLIDNNPAKNTLLNINIPFCKSVDEIAGAKFTKLGVKKYKNSFEERKDPRGNSYYWLAGELVEREFDEDTDIKAVQEGYISVTPMHFDLTDYGAFQAMGVKL